MALTLRARSRAGAAAAHAGRAGAASRWWRCCRGATAALCLAGRVPTYQDDEVVRRLLTTPARWAVVGLSTNRARAAHGVAAFLQRDLGMTIVPVHPSAETVHGAAGYRRLADVPGPVDVVDVFVNLRRAGAVVDEAIAAGARAVWLQLGVVDDDAAERARSAGLRVVMNRCPRIEMPRLGVAGPS